MGTTPDVVADVSPGSHKIRAEQAGYENAEQLAIVEVGVSQAVVLSLRAKPVAVLPIAPIIASIQPGKVFRDRLKDGSEGPEMVVVPAGNFVMWSKNYTKKEHSVTLARPFAMGTTEVTFTDYDRFATATGRDKPADGGWGRDNRPVINVRWDDAVAYAKWLSEQTGKRYRLPSAAEWEYAARAGSDTEFWWGAALGRNNANCLSCGRFHT